MTALSTILGFLLKKGAGKIFDNLLKKGFDQQEYFQSMKSALGRLKERYGVEIVNDRFSSELLKPKYIQSIKDELNVLSEIPDQSALRTLLADKSLPEAFVNDFYTFLFEELSKHENSGEKLRKYFQQLDIKELLRVTYQIDENVSELLDGHAQLNKKVENLGEGFNSLHRMLLSVIDLLRKPTLQDNIELPKKKEYREPKSLFDRFVHPADQFNYGRLNSSYELYELTNEKEQSHLVDIVEKEQRVVLLGIGGVGKSIELEKLAYHYSKRQAYVIFIRLKNVSDESIEELLTNEIDGWSLIPTDQLIIILDAIEEVHQPDFNRFVRRLNSFCRKHSESIVVASARTSFYSNSDNKESGTLSGFKEYGLIPLSYKQIMDFVDSKIPEAGRKFLDEANNLKIYELLQSPFYLINIVELYQENGSLPTRKSKLFDELLSQKVRSELKKYRLDGTSLDSHVYQLKKEIQKIAFAAECLEKNSLNEYTEFQAIVKPELVDKIDKTFLINKTGQRRSFEHNLFQEYLAASYLTGKDLSFIKRVSSLDQEGKVVNPSWHNTLTFLISILEKRSKLFYDILDWIIEEEEELVFLMEVDTLDFETQSEFTRRIITKYESRDMWCRGQLFNFGDVINRLPRNQNTIDWCIDRSNNSDEKVLVHSLYILKNQTINADSSKALIPILINQFLTEQFSNSTYKEICMLLINLEVSDKRIIKSLLSKPGFHNSEDLKLSFFRYIYHCDQSDQYVDTMIECISNNKSRIVTRLEGTNGRPGEIYNVVIRYLVRNLRNIKKDTAKQKILGWVKSNINSNDQLNNAIIEEVLDSVIGESKYFNFFKELLLLHNRTRSTKKRELIIRHFDLQNTKIDVLKTLIDSNSKQEHQSYYQIPFLLDLNLFKYLINEYISGNVTAEFVKGIRNIAMNRHLSYYAKFQAALLKVNRLEFRFVNLKREDTYEYRQLKRSKLDLHLLFNRPKVIQEVAKIYSDADKKTLTEDDLDQLYDREHEYCKWLVSLIHDFIKEDGELPLATLEAYLNDENNWRWYKSQELIRRSQLDEDIGVKGRNYLQSFFKKHITKANFKNSIKVHPDRSFTYNYKELDLIYIFSNFKIEAKKDYLLELLYCASTHVLLRKHTAEVDSVSILIDKLLAIFGEGKLLESISSVLSSTTAAYFVKEELVNYCYNQNYTEVLEFIPSLIENPKFEKHNKNRLVEQFFNLGGTFQAIEKYYSFQPMEVKFGIIRLSHKSTFSRLDVTNLVNEILKEDLKPEDRLQAILLKIETGSLEGYIDLKDWIKRNKDTPDERFLSNNLSNGCSTEVVRSLIEIYEQIVQLPINHNPFKGKGVYLELIVNAGMSSKENFDLVSKQFDLWISSLENHQFLHNRLIEMTKGYHRMRRSSLNINDVKELLQS